MTRVPAAIATALRDALHAQCFAPEVEHGPGQIGAEVEFLVVDADARRPVPLAGPGGSLQRVRDYGARAMWREGRTSSGTPSFEIPGRAVLTFEPGGQIEISTLACSSPNELLAALDAIVAPLRHSFAEQGIDLLAVGIDPVTPIECVPLQLHVDRYERMTRYFDRIGPFGVRMMRQTAAVQISLDRGAEPSARWRLLSKLAPYVIAIFANSACYAGRESRHKSFRARCWRMLDPSRTGTPVADGHAADEYMSFALAAPDMMRVDGAGEHLAFGDWIAAGDWDEARWARHLTTLFPEVRPRGHFEVRSSDAVDPSWYPALVVFLAGIAYDGRAAREAAHLLARDGDLLARAGQCGLADPAIASTSRDLVSLALEGASRFPADYLHPAHLDRARELFRTHAARGRSPGDAAAA
jgi:glutamate--cysteine ligase